MVRLRSISWLIFPVVLSGCPSTSSKPDVVPPPVVPTTSAIASAPKAATTLSATPTTLASAAPSASAIAVSPVAPIHVPATIGTDKRPFILYLHGLGASGKILSDAIGLPAYSAEKRFSWAAPDGAMSTKGQRFWNASTACCNFDNIPYPHVEELRRVLQTAMANPSVDPKRVFVVGMSNGGFMAHRLACEVDGLAGIVSISGAGPAEGETCTPPSPVSVVEIHGDADDVIHYEGGQAVGHAGIPRHPSALETISGWAKREHCGPTASNAGTLDLDDKLEGAETSILRFSSCQRPVELWTVHGATHYIGTSKKMEDAVISWIDSHPRP